MTGMEILAHINSPATKKNDDRYIRQAEGYMNFEAVRKICYSSNNKMKRRQQDDGETVSKRPKISGHHSNASTTTNVAKSPSLSKSHSEVSCKMASGTPRVDKIAIQRSFSDMISSSSGFLPQSPLKLLEVASNKWKSLRGKRASSSRNGDKLFEARVSPTESQLEDTQTALDCIHDDVYGESQETEKAASQDEIGDGMSSKEEYQFLEAGHKTTEGPAAFDISYMPSTLSTFDINASKGSLFDKTRTVNSDIPQGRNEDGLTGLGQPFHSEANVVPESELDSLPFSDFNSELHPEPSSAPEDPESQTNPHDEELKQSSKQALSNQMLSKFSLRVDSPHPTAKFLSVEGVPNSGLTLTLKSLTSVSNLPYSPSTKDRLPGRWERGFWLIPSVSSSSKPADWSLADQQVFWTRLSTRIRNGHAGIATWAGRNVNEDGTQSNDDMAQDGHAAELGDIRIYCWGGIAKEVYWLCMLESDGKVKGKNMRWISALTSDVIVRMD